MSINQEGRLKKSYLNGSQITKTKDNALMCGFPSERWHVGNYPIDLLIYLLWTGYLSKV